MHPNYINLYCRSSLQGSADSHAVLYPISPVVLNPRFLLALPTPSLQGESRSDLNAPACSHRIDRIRAVYGAPLARDLLPLDLHQGPSAAQERLALGPDDGPAFSANVSAPSPPL